MTAYDITAFSGPLDLLDHIIREQKADLLDLPIAALTDQYLEVLERSREKGLDMDLASAFLVFASTLISLKIRMLLPTRSLLLNEEGDDPREELVLRLMAYRRIKLLAEKLEKAHARYGLSVRREAETPEHLGLPLKAEPSPLSPQVFLQAVRALAERNAERFNTQNQRIQRLLKRDRFSVRESLARILLFLHQTPRFFFHERFPAGKLPRGERISAFQAVLELEREERVTAEQKKPFGAILIQRPDGAEYGSRS